MPTKKRLSRPQKIQLVAHQAVAAQTRIQTAVRAVFLVAAAAGISAVAAVATIQQSKIKLTVAVQPPGRNPVVAAPDAQGVASLGLRFRGWGNAVNVRELVIALQLDGDGDVRGKSTAQPLDASKVFRSCSVYTAPDQKISGPVEVPSGASELRFAMDLPVPARSWVTARVLCDIRPNAPLAGVAFTLVNPASVRASLGGKDLVAGDISFGLASRALNDRGASYALQVTGEKTTSPNSVVVGTTESVPANQGLIAGFLQAGSDTSFGNLAALRAEQKGVELGRWRLTADLAANGAEPLKIRKLGFLNCPGYGGMGPCTKPGAPTLFTAFTLSYVGADGKDRSVSVKADAQGRAVFSGLDVLVNPNSVVTLVGDVGPYFAELVGKETQFVLTSAEGLFEAVGVRTGSYFTGFTGEGTRGASSGTLFSFVRAVPSVRPVTPSQSSVTPSMTEVLRYDVAAVGTGPVSIRTMTFRLGSTDKGNTGWNLCEKLGQTSKWGLRDAADPDRRLENAADWSFYQADGTPCTPGRNLAFAVVDFAQSGDLNPLVTPAGTKRTIILRADTTLASGALHDTLRIDMTRRPDVKALPGFIWSDGIIPFSDRDPGIDFPVFGTTITF
jgi:hypothetical protein